MKILTFADTHIGKHNGNQFYLDLDMKVLEEIKKESNNIDMIVFLGDLCHNRGNIDQKSALVVRKYADVLNSFGIPVKMILGNHDIYYNSNKFPNYYQSFIDGLYDNIQCIYDILAIDDILFVGWLHSGKNMSEYNEINENYKWIFGHFEFKGVQLNKKFKSNFGHDNKNLNSYIFSGHYHTRIINNNLHYIGSPYPHNWTHKNDENQGYCIIDTDKEEITYKNLNLFKLIEYKLSEINDNLYDIDFKFIENNEIRLIVDIEIDDKSISNIKKHINSFNPKNLILETTFKDKINDEIEYSIKLSSPREFINEYLTSSSIEDGQKKRIMDIISGILND